MEIRSQLATCFRFSLRGLLAHHQDYRLAWLVSVSRRDSVAQQDEASVGTLASFSDEGAPVVDVA